MTTLDRLLEEMVAISVFVVFGIAGFVALAYDLDVYLLGMLKDCGE